MVRQILIGKTSNGMTSRKFGTESEKIYISKQDQKKIPKRISTSMVVNYLESKRLKKLKIISSYVVNCLGPKRLKKLKKIKNKSARF